MSELQTTVPANQELLDATHIVIGLFQDNFEPFDTNDFAVLNDEKDKADVTSGSWRTFETEDVFSKTSVGVVETYLCGRDETATVDGHLFFLYLEHPYRNYAFVVDLDSQEVGVKIIDGGPTTDLQPNRYPVIRQRVLGTLAMIATELF